MHANPKVKESNNTPVLIEASVADNAKIDPNTGPIQGVQPKAKLILLIKEKHNYLCNF